MFNHRGANDIVSRFSDLNAWVGVFAGISAGFGRGGRQVNLGVYQESTWIEVGLGDSLLMYEVLPINNGDTPPLPWFYSFAEFSYAI